MIHELVESAMMMKMDIYRQFEIQDVNSGAIKKQWNYAKTVSCHAKGSISSSTNTRSNSRQVFDNRYYDEQLIQVRTMDRIFSNEKITNITDSSGVVIWKELNYPTETPTVFEVIGTTPMTDALGRIIGYNTSLKRSENQQIGI